METPPPEPTPGWSARRVIATTLVVAAILALFVLVYRFSGVLFTGLLAVILSTGIRPAVRKLSRIGIPRSKGIILIYLAGFGLAVLLAIFILPLLLEQGTEISRALPGYYEDFRSTLSESPNRILPLLAAQLPEQIGLPPAQSGEEGGDSLAPVADSLSIVGMIARSAFLLTAVLMLCFYWTLESERFSRGLMLWVPTNYRDRLRGYFTEVEEKLGSFLVGQGILCLSVGVLALLAYSLLGLPYTLVLAIIAAIMEAVPVIGPALGAIPALLIAFAFDPSKVVWVVVASLLIQGLENYLLAPRLMKRSLGVNPLLVLLAIAGFSSLFGLAGAIVAIPLAAIIQLTLNRFVVRLSEGEVQKSDGRGQASLLRYEAQNLAQDMRKQIRRGDEQTEPPAQMLVDSLEAIARDLDQYLAESEKRMRST
ncbi:MAG TPA: AI-2E family transporter [Anaerolineales bacterium]|nr:AI-2E family transporter [Anaerolineales bacterium]